MIAGRTLSGRIQAVVTHPDVPGEVSGSLLDAQVAFSGDARRALPMYLSAVMRTCRRWSSPIVAFSHACPFASAHFDSGWNSYSCRTSPYVFTLGERFVRCSARGRG